MEDPPVPQSAARLRLLMTEKYDGMVVDKTTDSVTVAYDVGDDVVEQTYRAHQFADGQLPAVGTRLSVQVRVVATKTGPSDTAEELLRWDELEEHEP